MKSIKSQYLELKEGKMSQSNFLRNVRMSLPQYVTNTTNFEDTIRILRNKSILSEADVKNPNAFNPTEMMKGLRIEKCNNRDKDKEDIVKIVEKNLKKEFRYFYLNTHVFGF
jgi:hypothetical protein